MADELKILTGGVPLLRNKYYLIIYRGKDFLPPSVAAALAERLEITKQMQDDEEKKLTGLAEVATAALLAIEGHAVAGTSAEFYEAQARWGREVAAEEHERVLNEAARAKTARVVKRLEHKLGISDFGNADINTSNLEELGQFNRVSGFSQSEDETSYLESDDDEDEDSEWANDEDSEYSIDEDDERITTFHG
ncbi:chloroplastic group IIA intron splicing facilitator CRS1, chloroplastic-like [Lycium ferocissimum]|uniref:chloroplastic group IIA intron splicing facilitator CRS1, chloroplastic-like n=1 Tax=Lycium ferocissimum TaxID=112874 RepID=UPI002814EF98|nr:chloroplastic group IIA intron splicing facilitator CRS1, chloroplastic-like [Lycium ferocissimum]